MTFHYFPPRIPAARLIEQVQTDEFRLETESGIEIGLKRAAAVQAGGAPKRILLVVQNAESGGASRRSKPSCEEQVGHSREEALKERAKRPEPRVGSAREEGDEIYLCAPRGVGRTRWTRKNPPNYVEQGTLCWAGRSTPAACGTSRPRPDIFTAVRRQNPALRGWRRTGRACGSSTPLCGSRKSPAQS